jgi:hypothetical protein
VESNWVRSALQPPIDLLCQPRVIMMMEKLVEWLAGETEGLGENLSQCRFVHHKPHIPVRTRTRAAAVGRQRLTAWATARPPSTEKMFTQVVLICPTFLWIIQLRFHWQYRDYEYIPSDDGMDNEWWIGHDLEGSGRDLFEVLSRHFPGGTEETHENPQ